jgi:hypothetical protein
MKKNILKNKIFGLEINFNSREESFEFEAESEKLVLAEIDFEKFCEFSKNDEK